jgi:hypothetical protein
MQFDETGRLVRLPNKLSVQQMAAWALWTLRRPDAPTQAFLRAWRGLQRA